MPATQIKKIEFESPITLQENEQLATVFLNRPEGVVCKCVLIQADGNRVIVGDDLEDVIEDEHFGQGDEDPQRRADTEARGEPPTGGSPTEPPNGGAQADN